MKVFSEADFKQFEAWQEMAAKNGATVPAANYYEHLTIFDFSEGENMENVQTAQTELQRKKAISNRVHKYGWSKTEALEKPIRKKRPNNVYRKFDIINGEGKVIATGVTIEQAAKLLKVKRTTARAYTGYTWAERVKERGKGHYLVDSKEQ